MIEEVALEGRLVLDVNSVDGLFLTKPGPDGSMEVGRRFSLMLLLPLTGF